MSNLDHSNEQDDQASINAGQESFAADGEATDNSNTSPANTSAANSAGHDALATTAMAEQSSVAGQAGDASNGGNIALGLTTPNSAAALTNNLSTEFSAVSVVAASEASPEDTTPPQLDVDRHFWGPYNEVWLDSRYPNNRNFETIEVKSLEEEGFELTYTPDDFYFNFYFDEPIQLGEGSITITGTTADGNGNNETNLEIQNAGEYAGSTGKYVSNVDSIGRYQLMVKPFDTLDPHLSLLELSPNTEYRVSIGEDAVRDEAGNSFPGFDGNIFTFNTSETEIVLDTTAPTVDNIKASGNWLRYDGEQVHAILPGTTPWFRFSFTEDVVAGEGNITITNGTDVTRQISVAEEWPSYSGDDFNLDAGRIELSAGEDYSILIDDNAFKDPAGNYFAGISDPTSWSFHVAAADLPADSSTTAVINYDHDLDQNANQIKQLLAENDDIDWIKLEINDTRDYSISLEHPGNWSTINNLLKLLDDQGQEIAQQAASSPKLGLDRLATIERRLDPGTYYASVQAEGLYANKGLYTVSLAADKTTPDLYLASPQLNGTDIDPRSKIELSFSENIKRGVGNIKISNDKGDTRLIDIIDDADQVTIKDNRLFIKPTTALDESSQYKIEILKDVVTDRDGNSSSLAGQSAIEFKTGTTPSSPPQLTHAASIPTDYTRSVETEASNDYQEVILYFNQNLSRENLTPVSAFTIKADNETIEIDNYRILGNTVRLTPKTAIELGKTIQASYEAPEQENNKLQSAAGEDISTVLDFNVGSEITYAQDQGAITPLTGDRIEHRLKANSRQVYSFTYSDGQEFAEISPNSKLTARPYDSSGNFIANSNQSVSQTYYDSSGNFIEHESSSSNFTSKLVDGETYYLVVGDINYQTDQSIGALNSRNYNSDEIGTPFYIAANANNTKPNNAYLHDSLNSQFFNLGKVSGDFYVGGSASSPQIETLRTSQTSKPHNFEFYLETDATSDHSITAYSSDFSDRTVRLALYDASHNLLKTEYAGDKKENEYSKNTSLSLDGIKAGAYLLKTSSELGAMGNAAPPTYSLYFETPDPLSSVLASQQDEDLNIEAVNLGEANIGLTTSFNAINSSNDVDRYRFNIEENSTAADINLIFDRDQTNLQLGLYLENAVDPIVKTTAIPENRTGSRLKSEGDHSFSGLRKQAEWQGESLSIDKLFPGTYDLVVSSPTEEVGYYQLEFENNHILATTPDQYEQGSGNDNPENAALLNILAEKTSIGNLSIDSADDVDYFDINYSYPFSFEDISVKFAHGSGDLKLEFCRENNGSVINSISTYNDNESTVDGKNPSWTTSGLIKISGVDGATNTYTLEIDSKQDLPQYSNTYSKTSKDRDGNDQLGVAEQIVDLSLSRDDKMIYNKTLHDKDDVDAYRFSLISEGTAQDYIYTNLPGSRGQDINLYQEDASTWIKSAISVGSDLSSSADYDTTIPLAGLAAGDYVVKLSSLTPTHYKIGIGEQTENIKPFIVEDSYDLDQATNDTFATAVDLGVLKGHYNLPGLTLHSQDDIDYFKFQVEERTHFDFTEIHLTRDQDGGYLKLGLHDENQQPYGARPGTSESGENYFNEPKDKIHQSLSPETEVYGFRDTDHTFSHGTVLTAFSDGEHAFFPGTDYYLSAYGVPIQQYNTESSYGGVEQIYKDVSYELDLFLPPTTLPDTLYPEKDQYEGENRNDHKSTATPLGEINSDVVLNDLTFDIEHLTMNTGEPILSFGVPMQSQGASNPRFEIDAFTFSLKGDQHLNDSIYVTHDGGFFSSGDSTYEREERWDHLVAELWNEDFTQSISKDGYKDGFSLFGLPEGDYGLVVRSLYNTGAEWHDSFNQYNIEFDTSNYLEDGSRAGDQHEGATGNDRWQDATQLNNKQIWQGYESVRGSLHDKQDDDFYKFTIAENESYQLGDPNQIAHSYILISSEQDIDLYLLNSDQEVVYKAEEVLGLDNSAATTDVFGNRIILPKHDIKFGLEPGDYYLKVQADQVDRTLSNNTQPELADHGDYRLDINLHYSEPLSIDDYDASEAGRNDVNYWDDLNLDKATDLGVISNNIDGTSTIYSANLDQGLKRGDSLITSLDPTGNGVGDYDTYSFTLNHKFEEDGFIKVTSPEGYESPGFDLINEDFRYDPSKFFGDDKTNHPAEWGARSGNGSAHSYHEGNHNILWGSTGIHNDFRLGNVYQEFNPPEPGEYLLTVGPGKRGDYTIEINGPPNSLLGDIYDQRDVLDTAANAIEIDQSSNKDIIINDLTLHYSEDKDYFKFTLDREGLATDSINLSSDNANIGGTISTSILKDIGYLDPYGDVQYTRVTNNDRSIEDTKRGGLAGYQPGEYIIKVNYDEPDNEYWAVDSNYQFEPITYQLATNIPYFDESLSAVNFDEKLEGLDETIDIGLVSTHTQLLDQTISFKDIDKRAFSLDTAGTKNQGIGITFEHQEGDLQLQLIRPSDQAVLKSSDISSQSKNANHEWISLDGIEAGNYQAVVSGVPNQYDFEIITDKNSILTTSGRQNHTIAQAQLLTDSKDEQLNSESYLTGNYLSSNDGQNLKGEISQLSFSNDNFIDYYKFSTPYRSSNRWQPEKNFVEVNFWNDLGNVDLELLSGDGEDILEYSHGFANTERIELIDLPADDYILKVIGRGQNNSYSLNYELPVVPFTYEDTLNNQTTKEDIELALSVFSDDKAFTPATRFDGPEWHEEILPTLPANSGGLQTGPSWEPVNATLSPDNKEDWYQIDVTHHFQSSAGLFYDPRDANVTLEVFEKLPGEAELTPIIGLTSGQGQESISFEERGPGSYYFRVSTDDTTNTTPYSMIFYSGREIYFTDEYKNRNITTSDLNFPKPLGDVYEDHGTNDWFNSVYDESAFNFDAFTYELDNSLASGQFVGKQELTNTAISNPSDADFYQFNLRDHANENHFIQAEFEQWDMDLDLFLFDQNNQAFRSKLEDIWMQGNWFKGNIFANTTGSNGERQGLYYSKDALSNSDNEEINLDGLPEGEYVLAVVPHRAYLYSADYDLKFNLPEKTISADPYEVNNSPETLYDLGAFTGRRSQYNLSIHDSNDVDYIGFETKYTGAAGDYINLDYFINDGELQFDLIDRNSDSSDQESIVKSSTQKPFGSNLSLEGVAPGQYSIRVSGVDLDEPNSNGNDKATNNYQIDYVLPTNPDRKDAWTIMYYFPAYQDIDMHYTINLLEAQIKQWDLPDEVNFAVMWDQPDWVDLDANKSTGAGEQAKWNTTGRSILRSDNTTKWISSDFEVLEEKNMGDPTTVTEFIQWANRVAPAENQALFIHGHSLGLGSIITDNEVNAPLHVDELAASLEQLKTDESIDLELLRMDGCLTGTLELAYELKDSAQFTIGSEQISGAGSGTYRSHAQWLDRYPYEIDARDLASSMIEDFKINYPQGSNFQNTLSAIDTSKLTALADSLSAFVDSTDGLSPKERHRINLAGSFAPSYGKGASAGMTVDLGQFMRSVSNASELPESVRIAAQNVVESVETAVINKNYDAQRSDGISISFTTDPRHSKFNQDTQWHRFLEGQAEAATGDFLLTPINDWSAANNLAAEAFNLGRLSGNDIDIDSLAVDESTSKYFRFTLVDAAADDTTVELSSPTEDLSDLQVLLWTNNHSEKLRDSADSNGQKIHLVGLEADDYLLEIKNNGAPIPNSLLTLNLPNDPTPSFNYNNLEHKAAKLGLIAGPELTLGTTSPSSATEDGEWLYYNIETSALSGIQQNMNVEVNVADGAEYEAVILDSNNNVISTVTGTGSNSLDYSASGSGEEYTLKFRQLKPQEASAQSALAPPGASSTFSLLFTPGEALAASVNDDGPIVEIGSTLNQSEAIALILDQGNQVTIPEGYGSIGDSAFKDRDLANVVIPDSVTEIGDNAFFNTQLTTVEIPNSVTSIGDNAFFNTQLASVDLGNNISSIGNNAFQNTQLTSVELGDSVQSIGDSAFMDTPLASVVIGNSITTIANNAFRNTELTQVEIPNSVTSIGVNAFINTQLASVVIPDSVTSIGESAFAGTKLTSVDIGSGVTSIGPNAFYNTQLASVVIPNGVATIGDNAFFNTQLTTVEIPNSVTSIGDKAFFNTQLASVVIPDSVSSLGRHAFASTKLTSVDIGSGVRSIGQNAFSDTQLASVVIPNGVTTIGGGAFLNTQLASVVIPDSVTSIGESAFAGTKLTSVDIGSGVTSIGPNAFYDTQLASVVIPNGVTTIAHNAFRNTELTQVEIPASLTSINDNVFKSTNLSSVVIPDSVTSIGRGAFSDTHLTSVEIPNSVTEIGEGAFDNTQLTSVVIPDSVTRISDGVFRDTPLTSVVIGKNVISIGDEAFSGTQLTSVVIPSTVTTIGDNAFQNSQLTSAVIGDGVTSIGDNAFSNTQLKTVEIPASVTSIGDGAFDGTPLTTVFVPEGFEIDASAFDSSVVITTIGTGPDIRTNPDIASSWAENKARADFDELELDLELGYSLHLKEGTEAEQATARKQLAVLGDSVDLSDIYQLDITAKSLAAGYNLATADITINFDPYLFNEIKASDITIGGQLPIANAVRIDNDVGTIRIAAASLGDLDPGDLYGNHLADAGASIGEDGAVLASIDLNFNELNLAELNQNSDGSIDDLSTPLFFGLSANQDETVFSTALEDESGFDNREIKSLRELGGDLAVEGEEVTLYEATINLEEQGDGLILSSDLDIGSYNSKQTNLVRTGDTITATSQWTNVGNIKAENIAITGVANDNASLLNTSSFYISSTESYQASTNLESGSFVDGAFLQAGQETAQLVADIEITGAAGNVVDLSQGILSLQATGSDVFKNQKGSKNLITFQGDLNYDGRVSMKDLAYLNAGAARQQQASEHPDAVDANNDGFVDASVARGVDANFDGQISMADLAVLDADWGQSLHQQPINGANGSQSSFTGSNQISWVELDNQGTTGDAAWDNQAFKDQNALEAGNDFVESLENPTAVGVIGADGNTTANDGDMQGTEFQDPLTA